MLRPISFKGVLKALAKLVGNFTVQRVTVAGLIFFTSLALAKILGVANFGQVAFYMYLIKFFLSGQLGSESGYFHQFYSSKGSLDPCSYLTLYSLQLWLVALFASFLGIYLDSVYFFAATGFAILVPLFAAGPALRIQRMFGVTLLPDLIISLTALVGALIWRIFGFDQIGVENEVLILSVFLILFFCPLIFVIYKKINIRLKFNVLVEIKILKQYLLLIKVGIPLFLATLAYTFLLMVDRFFLEKYHTPQTLSVYMLGFQIVMGASLILTSQNFISVINIGEGRRDNADMRELLKQQLIKSTKMGCISYLGLIFLAVVVEKYYLTGFEGLTFVCAILGLGFIAFSISGSITTMVFYEGRQGSLSALLIIIIGLSVLHNKLVIYMKWPPLWVTFFTAGWLILYSFASILLTLSIAGSRSKNENSTYI